MNLLKHFKFAGSRVIKTGLSIFVTAWICVLLEWPPVFAVITAIVTMEPSVSSSIQKGLIRFPASAIGSAYAVLFISLFGNSPIAYTLAAVLTIATCVHFQLHAGLFVATLTSVAMVEVIDANILVSFFIRLGTTTVGLVVSTIVNLLVLPPNYTDAITKKLRIIERRTGDTIEKSFAGIFQPQKDHTVEKELYDQLADIIQEAETLTRFQRDETKFHPLVGKEKAQFEYLQNQLIRLQQIHYHTRHLDYAAFKNTKLTADEQRIILDAAHSLAQSLKQPATHDDAVHKGYLNQLTNIFWADNKDMIKHKQSPNRFPPDTVMLYELVSIYNLVERYLYEKAST